MNKHTPPGPNGLAQEGDQTGPSKGFPGLRFDPQEYMHFVEDEDLTEAEAIELLRAIWTIMVAFVDLGFNIHPMQLALDKSSENAELFTSDSLRMLLSDDQFSDSIQATNTVGRAGFVESEES